MDEYKKLKDLIYKYRVKIADFNKIENYYIYTDYTELLHILEKSLLNLQNIIDNELSFKFLRVYSSANEAILDIEPILNKILFEMNKLKGLYKALEKESSDEKIKIYRKIIKKIIRQVETFFIKLENLVLQGGSGQLNLEINIDDEIAKLKKSFKKKNSFSLESFLLGLGLGWFFFSDDE